MRATDGFRHHSSGGFWCGGDLLEDGRQGDAEGAAYGINGVAWSGSQQRAAAVLLDFDLAEFVEIIYDVAPLQIITTACGEEVEQFLPENRGEETAEDVTADGRVGLMEDRPRGAASTSRPFERRLADSRNNLRQYCVCPKR